MPAPGVWDACPCKALSPSSDARSGPAGRRYGAVVVSVSLRSWAILASTRPRRARSSSALARASASPNRARRRHTLPVRSARIQSEAEFDGPPPGVAVLGEVREPGGPASK